MGHVVTLELDRLFEEAVGKEGLSAKGYETLLAERGAAALEAVHARADEDLGFIRLPDDRARAETIQTFAESRKGRFENLIILGIGGSALGNLMMKTALAHPFHDLLPSEKRGGWPRLFIPDNVDAWELAGLLETIDLKKTLVNVITKSGSTAETMASYLVVRGKMESVLGPDAVKDHLVFTTDAVKGDLRAIAQEEGIETCEVPANVGGRFTVLSPVGLFSSAFLGVDLNELLDGAAAMAERCCTPEKNPALAVAASHYLLDTQKKKSISVMMPYSERLRDCADWYRQLWAESLGKEKNRSGQTVRVGQTPVKALGATDQHSQVQLYVEGPNDKVITFLRVERQEHDLVLPSLYQGYSSLNYLGGHSMNELLDAECRATRYAVTAAGRPNITVNVPEVSANTMGQFIYLYEMATALAGEFYDINAFDQPGVEAGKKATYALLGRKGYEDLAETLRASEGAAERVV